MRRRGGAIFIIILLAMIIGFSIYESDVWKTQREGIDEQIMIDAFEVAEIIDRYHNELEYNYDEVYEDDKELIEDFGKNKYIDDNEKASKEENELLAETLMLTSTYMTYDGDTEDKTRDYDKEINDSIKKVRDIISKNWE